MSNGYNSCTFVGNLVRDPETKSAQSGTVYCKSSIAVNSGFGDKEKCLFLNFTAFGKTAEAIQKFVGKGDRVLLSGELQCDEVEQDDGSKRYYWSLVVQRCLFLQTKGDKKKDAGTKPKQASDPTPATAHPEVDPDNIPF